MRNIKIGVEIEFFGVGCSTVIDALRNEGIRVDYMGYTHEVVSGWKLVTDVSVTGYGTGVGKGLELVSPILYGDEGLDELQLVMNTLENIGARVDKSCGLHVHHDIADYSVENIVSLYRMYYNYSKGIDSILPKSRRTDGRNPYCKKLSRSEIDELNSCRTVSQVSYSFSTRYVSLNCKSYVKYGTIEFRQHSGTIDFEKLEAWIVLTHCMVNYCKHNEVELKSRNTGTIEQLLKVLNLEDSFAGNYLIERKRTLCA